MTLRLLSSRAPTTNFCVMIPMGPRKGTESQWNCLLPQPLTPKVFKVNMNLTIGMNCSQDTGSNSPNYQKQAASMGLYTWENIQGKGLHFVQLMSWTDT